MYTELIGVIPPPFLYGANVGPPPDLGQLLLFFDKLAAPEYHDYIADCHGLPLEMEQQECNIEWLIDCGLLDTTPPQHYGPEEAGNHPAYMSMLSVLHEIEESYLRDPARRREDQAFARGLQYDLEKETIVARYLASTLTSETGKDACVVTPHFNFTCEGCNLPIAALEFAICSFPVPKSDIPFERIIEFRNDPDTKYKMAKFRSWIKKTAAAGLPAAEVEHEIDDLLTDYTRHMELYRLESDRSSLRFVVATTLEAVENLVKLRWSALANQMFAFRRRDVQLMQEEMKAPGAAVAYVAKVQQFLE